MNRTIDPRAHGVRPSFAGIRPCLIGMMVRIAGVCASAALLSACVGSGLNPFGETSTQPASVQQGPADTIGNGPVRIALILPLSAANGAVPARSLRNAAELAATEFSAQELTILVKDDKGTPEGATAAAQEALAEGAELIIGPLFAPSVQAVATVAKPAGRPIIAFSSDANAGGRGVYLLSFLPQSDVQRIVAFAIDRGKKSFAALIPQTPYGNVAEAEFMQQVTQRGARVVSIERYQAGKAGIDAALAKIGPSIAQADALFVPDNADGMPAVAAALAASGLNKVQLLGTGVWNDARLYRAAGLQGAWFAAPDSAGFANFAGRYRAKFGSDPTRIASLSYDAVALASALVKRQGTQRYSEAVLTSPDGFAGQDGVFRFRTDGLNERGLSVLEIRNGQATIISPSPRSFVGGN